ncbi:MAG: hypothetical protein IJD25_02275, partial [Alphaproteobacteria bacterium]|nr:hypothetical protein [Alphaproteobacteria bacterium]
MKNKYVHFYFLISKNIFCNMIKKSFKMTKKLYYTKALLKNELDKCLSCKDKPCQHACPVGCDPNFFIKKAKEN